MQALKDASFARKWGKAAETPLARRNVFVGELTRVGIKNPTQLATPSVRNDLAFLTTTVGVASVGAVSASFLPGGPSLGCSL